MKRPAILSAVALLLSLCLMTGCQTTQPGEPVQPGASQTEQGDTSAPALGGIVLGGRDAVGTNGVVSSGRKEVSQIGVDIMTAGGNAVDAAVAMGFALGVCEQQSSGIGGGGFMMVRFADTEEIVFLDFRDQSAAAASLDMWTIDEKGRVQDRENQIGGKAVAVPGEVKGLLYALDTYGSMERQTVMQPAIDMATEGFLASGITVRDITDAFGTIKRYPATAALYLNGDGLPYAEGDVLKNPDLANTLQLIADQGQSVFYTGEIAQKIVAAVQADGGCLTLEDMAGYELTVGQPVHGTYRGYDIYSSNLPSSGGTIIIEMLNIMEHFDLAAMDPQSATYFHLLSEVMKLGFADRSAYMGDPNYVDVPKTGLIDKNYAAGLAATIDMSQAQTHQAGNPWPYESEDTTHFSIIDKEGNMVAVTVTNDATFASGVVADGTGILLNDTLYDFSLDPDSPNVVAGNKRPLSSMSPTLILKDGEPYLSLGAPGTTRIITGVLQVITKTIDHGMDIQDAIDAVRMHDDFGTLILEDRVSQGVKDELVAMGHTLNTDETWFTFPCIQAVARLEDGTLRGAADPRRDGYALGY